MYTTRRHTGMHTNKHIHAPANRASRRCLSGLARQHTHSACSNYTESGRDHCLRGAYVYVSGDKRAAPRHAHGLDQGRSNGRHTPRE